MNVYNDKGWGYLKDLKSSEADYAECTSVASFLKKSVKNDEYIFTAFHRENVMNLLIGEKALFPTREIVFFCAEPLKVFDYSRFSSMVEGGKVKYLVGKKGVQPDMFLGVAFHDYEKMLSVGSYDIYEHKELNNTNVSYLP